MDVIAGADGERADGMDLRSSRCSSGTLTAYAFLLLYWIVRLLGLAAAEVPPEASSPESRLLEEPDDILKHCPTRQLGRDVSYIQASTKAGVKSDNPS